MLVLSVLLETNIPSNSLALPVLTITQLQSPLFPSAPNAQREKLARQVHQTLVLFKLLIAILAITVKLEPLLRNSSLVRQVPTVPQTLSQRLPSAQTVLMATIARLVHTDPTCAPQATRVTTKTSTTGLAPKAHTRKRRDKQRQTAWTAQSAISVL